MGKVLQFLLAISIGPAAVVAFVWVGERLLVLLPHRRRQHVRPWLWVTPALLLVLVFLAWPLVDTIRLSLLDADSTSFVGLANYIRVVTSENLQVALRNNLMWLVFLVPGTLLFGLLLAALTNRVRYERVVKTVVFVPMAISFVAGATIWKFMYDYRPPGTPQVGTVNAAWIAAGGEPHAWLVEPALNNLAIILVGLWTLTGFSMVILSAAVKGIPSELVDAARVDGATEWHVFRRIVVPLLRPALVLVATTMFINAIKIFDIVWVLTGGNFDTGVVATEMYRQMFTSRDFGQASMLSVVLLLAAIPILVVNTRGYRRQVSGR